MISLTTVELTSISKALTVDIVAAIGAAKTIPAKMAVIPSMSEAA